MSDPVGEALFTTKWTLDGISFPIEVDYLARQHECHHDDELCGNARYPCSIILGRRLVGVMCDA